jgi:hypothetical protein
MSSILLNVISNKTNEELANLGNGGNKHNTPGTHLFTIASVYELAAANYSAIIIEGTINGEDFKHMEFLGKAKDDTQAEIDKANARNERVAAMLSRFAKAAGFKDVAQAVSGATVETTDKGEKTNFPKFVKKQLHVTTTTEVQPNKDETKAYANQVLDTMKFLDKSGKDGMGRDRLDAYNEEAKAKLEIQYGKEGNPACIQKFNELKEKALGIAPQPAPQQAAPVTGGMPTAAPTPVAAVPLEDI